MNAINILPKIPSKDINKHELKQQFFENIKPYPEFAIGKIKDLLTQNCVKPTVYSDKHREVN